MPIFDIFRNLFGGNRKDPLNSGCDHPPYGNSFRNPIWQNNEDDDGDDSITARHPNIGMNFNVFSDPIEITRYFESQIENIFRNFGFNNSFLDTGEFQQPLFESKSLLQPKNSLRDNYLKPEYKKPSFNCQPGEKIDEDLDGKVTSDEISQFWKNHESNKITKTIKPNKKTMGKYVTRQIIQRSDGMFEEKKTIRDSEGNEEVVVARKIGDKQHIITTKRDTNGLETKTEDLINMDENELPDFNKKWFPTTMNNIDDNKIFGAKRFSWERLFGPYPKL
ncbi:uncharacterized protein [Prorops nasuta]|uniref:uncharacterized protein n=1 Tax=Prorops nasuta TaxID=863751 RepID=UPI0034CF1B8E